MTDEQHIEKKPWKTLLQKKNVLFFVSNSSFLKQKEKQKKSWAVFHCIYYEKRPLLFLFFMFIVIIPPSKNTLLCLLESWNQFQRLLRNHNHWHHPSCWQQHKHSPDQPPRPENTPDRFPGRLFRVNVGFGASVFTSLRQHNTKQRSNGWPWVCLVVFTLSFTLGLSPVPWILVGEILPGNWFRKYRRMRLIWTL